MSFKLSFRNYTLPLCHLFIYLFIPQSGRPPNCISDAFHLLCRFYLSIYLLHMSARLPKFISETLLALSIIYLSICLFLRQCVPPNCISEAKKHSRVDSSNLNLRRHLVLANFRQQSVRQEVCLPCPASPAAAATASASASASAATSSDAVAASTICAAEIACLPACLCVCWAVFYPSFLLLLVSLFSS